MRVEPYLVRFTVSSQRECGLARAEAPTMPASAIEEDVLATQELLAKLCVQLEAVDSEDALHVLRTYQVRLQKSIAATIPKKQLLELPPELLLLLVQRLLRVGDGACLALAALRSTCAFFSAGASVSVSRAWRDRARAGGCLV